MRCTWRNPDLPRGLGGMSPIDHFLLRMRDSGVLDAVDAVPVHGFPLDWNHWQRCCKHVDRCLPPT
jgi:hypothetical protein